MKNLILMMSLIFLLTQCKKDNLTELDSDKMVTQDNNEIENISDDISSISDEAYTDGKLTTKMGNEGNAILSDTVKISLNKSDSTITVDFGSNGILCKDGKTRKGKIFIKFSNGYKVSGSSHEHTFDNYYVNDKKVEGKRTVTYLGLVNNFPTWTINADLIITKSDGSIITWKSNRTRKMIKGYSTISWFDDEYLISGNSNGVYNNGTTYSYNISKDLYIKVGCRYIQDGELIINRGSKTFTINYGYSSNTSNDCNNEALLTYNGIDYIITLK